MTEAPASAVTPAVVSLLHDIISKPFWESAVLIVLAGLVTFFVVGGLAFALSRIRGEVDIDFLSLFRIGKKREELTSRNDINIVVNNTPPSTSAEFVKEENKLLNEMIGAEDMVEKDEIIAEKTPGDPDNVLLMVISKSVRFGSDISKYKEVYLIKSQMAAAELRSNIIENILIKDYMEVIYKKNSKINIQDDQSYRIFEEIVHNQAHRNILAVLRRLFKDNHLTQYDEEGFNEYSSVQCERIITQMKLSINGSIPSFLDPGREAVNIILDRSNQALLETFKDIFSEARVLAFRTESVIRKKEKDFDDEIKKLTGISEAHKRADIASEDPYAINYKTRELKYE